MIAAAEYQQRRHRVMQAIGKNAIAIVPTAAVSIRNGDATYPYRTNSDFYYLTGFSEPDAVLVLAPGSDHGEFILFNLPSDPAAERWTGRRVGQAGAVAEYGADAAFPIDELETQLLTLLAECDIIYYPMGRQAAFDAKVSGWLGVLQQQVRTGRRAPTQFRDIATILHELRLVKSPTEIALMQQAASISAQAHVRAMQRCQPGLYEYQLAAEVHYVMAQAGCQHVAYDSIVGGGANACVLHYVANDCVLRDGDLVLIDAGAEYYNYAADITRTFPVNGRFSAAQQAIYELVLAAQLAGIKTIKAGTPWPTIQEAIVHVLVSGLVDLNILVGDVPTLIAEKAYRQFYMHNSGHWLGLDVHDAGSYKVAGNWRPLAAGMVLTVEPGLYISPSANVAEKWWNIGVRIEDDVLVTAMGADVLTHEVPKTCADIMALMQ